MHFNYSKEILQLALAEAEILGDPGKVFIGGELFGGSVAMGAFLLNNHTVPFGGIMIMNSL